MLLLLVDGVPWERIRDLHVAGHFRMFHPPSKLISVFPTLTDPAYDLLFETGPSPGYEAGYFDRQTNRLSPALAGYLRGQNEAWVRYADYRLSFLNDALMYLFPKWVYRSELRSAGRVLERRLASGARQVVLYILSTDGLAHMLAPAELDRQLAELDRWIASMQRGPAAGLPIVMMADHGLGRLPAGCRCLRRFDLRRVLHDAGLRVVRRLKRPGDLVLPTLGLLDVARLHTFDSQTRDCAVAALRRSSEIELIAARDSDCLQVFAGDQTARVRRRQGPDGTAQYAYEPGDGDPLHLRSAVEALRAAGHTDGKGFAPARAWLEATADSRFPAAPQRLWEGVFSISREQPDVVLSLNERCFCGSGLLSKFVRMQGTHGGLHQRVAATFVMATTRPLPSPLDLREAGRLLREEFGWQVRGRR